jgi:serine/threonine protein kinase
MADTHTSLLNLGYALSETQISGIIEQVLHAVVYLHENQVYMRNLHPGNIFISNENSNDVLITDAGLCQLRGVN